MPTHWAAIGFDTHVNAVCFACGTPANPVGTGGEPGSCLHYQGPSPAEARCCGCVGAAGLPLLGRGAR